MSDPILHSSDRRCAIQLFQLVLFFRLVVGACNGDDSSSKGGDGDGDGDGNGDAGATCNPACGEARDCCRGICANLQNDPMNCGACGVRCEGDTYCSGGQCVTPPCDATCGGAATCCGSECCGAGQLCCDPQGPLDMGPHCIEPSEQGTCPPGCAPLCICASADTPVATPQGEIPIASLQVGDLVYSVDRGAIVVVPIVQTNRTPVSSHHVVRVTLASGSVIEMSALHPTADGRRFGELSSGGELDGVEIQAIEVVPYLFDATYDILPDSDTGAYFAGGAIVGSTLSSDRRRCHADARVCDGLP